MTSTCDTPVSDDDLLDYWTGATAERDAAAIEEHLFSCADCAVRLDSMASFGAGLSTLVRRGRVSGILSRSLLNRIQRDGVRVRVYSLSPGERVPCAAFPGDELLVVALRADFTQTDAVALSVDGVGDGIGHIGGVPVSREDNEVLWATPADSIRQLPSSHVHLTLTSETRGGEVLARYELDHTAIE